MSTNKYILSHAPLAKDVTLIMEINDRTSLIKIDK